MLWIFAQVLHGSLASPVCDDHSSIGFIYSMLVCFDKDQQNLTLSNVWFLCMNKYALHFSPERASVVTRSNHLPERSQHTFRQYTIEL